MKKSKIVDEEGYGTIQGQIITKGRPVLQEAMTVKSCSRRNCPRVDAAGEVVEDSSDLETDEDVKENIRSEDNNNDGDKEHQDGSVEGNTVAEAAALL